MQHLCDTYCRMISKQTKKIRQILVKNGFTGDVPHTETTAVNQFFPS